MSFVKPITNTSRIRTKPTMPARSMTSNGIRLPADLLGHRPEHVAAVEREEREQVDDRQRQRDQSEDEERLRRAVGERLLGGRVPVDDAVELLSLLGLEDSCDDRDGAGGDVPHIAAGQRCRLDGADRLLGRAELDAEQRTILAGGVCTAGGPRTSWAFRRGGQRSRAGVAATQPLTWAPAHWWVPIWFRMAFSEPPDAVDRDDAGRRDAGPPRTPAPSRSSRRSWSATDWPCDRAIAQKIRNAIRRLTAGPARITTIRFQTFWL